MSFCICCGVYIYVWCVLVVIEQQTLSAIVSGLFGKRFSSSSSFGYDVLNIMCGVDFADVIWNQLLQNTRLILAHHHRHVHSSPSSLHKSSGMCLCNICCMGVCE